MRATEWYDIAGISGTLIGMSHFSMNWTLPEEEEKFRELSRDAVAPAFKLDSTINRCWTDLGMYWWWFLHRSEIQIFPKFLIRTFVDG